ncbi:MAG TPA: transporter substrate-binding domain-containing protein [Actinomycetes bacterium]|jgi:polar amino acid transport system substrate-binding protein|nr:transporter substrate-binding domain-containing protein [Actinomycetes bacterium]
MKRSRTLVRRRLSPLLPLAFALAAALGAAACGGGAQRAVLAAQPVNQGPTPLGRQLPAKIRNAREIRVGSDISYAPLEFYDALAPDVLDRPIGEPAPQVQGIDPDLAGELGRKLGVRFTFVDVKFDDLADALRNGRVDVIISGMAVTPERASQMSFIEYFRSGTSLVAAKGNPEGIRGMGDLCGKTVTMQEGTVQEDLARAQRRRCPASQPLRLRPLDSGSQALLDVKYGDADVALTDFPVAAYNAKVSGGGEDYEVVGGQVATSPLGIGVRKAAAALRDALRDALRQVIADGGYDRVLDRWNVTGGALKSVTVLGAPRSQ